MTKTCSLLPFLLLAPALVSQGPDDRAAATPMFLPSGYFGTSGPILDTTSPPLLGSPFGLRITADPSAAFGVTFGSLHGVSGFPLVFVDPLSVYLDPLSLILDMPMPLSLGLGLGSLPIPPDPLFQGLDLALQAVVLSPSGVGASNLLAVNIGSHVGGGDAICAFTFTAHVPTNAYYNAGGQPLSIHCNNTNRVCQITISGTRNGTGGRLEIRNSQLPGLGGGASVLAVVPTIQTQFSVTVTVQPGECLYLFNRDDMTANGLQTGPIDVTYQVRDHCP